MHHCQRFAISALAFGLLGVSIRAAEPSRSATKPVVRQTTFNEAADTAAQQQSIRFGRRPASVGDQTEQTSAVEMRLTLNMRRGNDLVGKNQTTVRTSQRRVITCTAVDAGRTSTVKVQYPEATKQVLGASDAGGAIAPDGKSATPQSSSVAQPVQGKTYLCRREAGESGRLIVTDDAGNPPPTEEYEIVAQQMDMVGRANPLAQFLAGRSVAIGEKLELPKELAGKIFNLGDKFGEVTRFTLTLQKVAPENGANCAVFLASVDASSSGASQMRLQVEGPFVVEVDTCRAARINLVGPIGMSETRGSYSTAYQVIGTGRMQTTIASAYRDAQR
jgi:hypothetical protein